MNIINKWLKIQNTLMHLAFPFASCLIYKSNLKQIKQMSMAKSNISNDSSRSNIFTLSQDSYSSQIKPNLANIVYKKFIGRLTELFRIDTQDLDLLYNKIVQCVNESQSFVKSDDADINELIELAGKLKESHNMLKNMVEVLNQRFFQNANQSKAKDSPRSNNRKQQQFTPRQKIQQNYSYPQTTSILKKKSMTEKKKYQKPHNESQQSIRSKNNDEHYFDVNIQQKTKEQIEKLKLFQPYSHQHITSQSPQQKQSTKHRQSTQEHIDQKKIIYEDRIHKIIQEVNKLKQQLHQIDHHQLQNQISNHPNLQVSLNLQNSQNNHQKSPQNQPQQNANNNPDEDQHRMFKKLSQDDYYLHDDRYLKNENQNSNAPKLSFKQLYSQLGVDPNDQNNFNTTLNKNQMCTIRQSSRQSQSLIETHHKQNSLFDELHQQPLHPPSNFSIKSIKKIQTQSNQQDASVDSQRSYNVSNATIIDTLTNTSPHNKRQSSNHRKTQKNISFPILEEQESHVTDESGGNFIKKKQQAFGQVQTVTVIHTVDNLSASNIPKQAEQTPESQKKPKLDMSIIERNELSTDKTRNSLQRLDQRNAILKRYVIDISNSYKKQNQKQQKLVTINNSQKNSIIINLQKPKTLTNLIYTQNEIFLPKYVPISPSKTTNQQNNNKELQSTNFTYSEVVQKKDNNSSSQFNSKPTSSTFKQIQFRQFTQHRNIQQQSEEKVIKSVVPTLMSLVQNSGKSTPKSANSQKILGMETKKLTLKNSYYLPNNSNFDNEKITEPKFQNINIANQKEKLAQLHIQTHKYKSSLQSRWIDNQSEQQTQMKSNERKTLSTPNSTHQLYQKLETKQSKPPSLQNPAYQIRLPGQQIQQIKQRVNSMFRKIKLIRNDTNNPLNQLQINQPHSPSDKNYSIVSDPSEQHQSKEQLLHQSKQHYETNEKLFSSSQHNQMQQMGVFYKKGDETGKFNNFQQKNNYDSKNSNKQSPKICGIKPFPQSQNSLPQDSQLYRKYPNSLINTNKPVIKINPMPTSPTNISADPNRNKGNQPIHMENQSRTVMGNKDSILNYSFRSQQSSQQFMRNSITNPNQRHNSNVMHPQISRTQSHSSVQSKNWQRILTISPKKQFIIDRVVEFSKPSQKFVHSKIHRSPKIISFKSTPIISPQFIANNPPVSPKFVPFQFQPQPQPPFRPTLYKSYSQVNIGNATNLPPNNFITTMPINNKIGNVQKRYQVKYEQPPPRLQVAKAAIKDPITDPSTPSQKGCQCLPSLCDKNETSKFKQSQKLISTTSPSITNPAIIKPQSCTMKTQTSRKQNNSKTIDSFSKAEKSLTQGQKDYKGINVLSKNSANKQYQQL